MLRVWRTNLGGPRTSRSHKQLALTMCVVQSLQRFLGRTTQLLATETPQDVDSDTEMIEAIGEGDRQEYRFRRTETIHEPKTRHRRSRQGQHERAKHSGNCAASGAARGPARAWPTGPSRASSGRGLWRLAQAATKHSNNAAHELMSNK